MRRPMYILLPILDGTIYLPVRYHFIYGSLGDTKGIMRTKLFAFCHDDSFILQKNRRLSGHINYALLLGLRHFPGCGL
jgi:hypothetical protein